MRSVAIAYYAHHHGSGHIRRALAIARQMDRPLAIFSSAPCPPYDIDNVTFHSLASDTETRGTFGMPSISAFHYAPLGIRGVNERMRVLAAWFGSHWPCLLVVDVSVEVALFARLCAVPTIYVRQNGDRADLPHALAYESAVRLLAPFPEGLAACGESNKWESKTIYAGLISRYTHLLANSPRSHFTVAVLIGRGGTSVTFEQLCAAANATPDWVWSVIGPVLKRGDVAPPANLNVLGIVADPREHLCRAEIVVGSAGDNVVAEMAHLRCKYISLSETRPFDEQIHTATALDSLGVAIHYQNWPEPSSWPGLLRRAAALDTDNWDRFIRGDGATNAARAIQSTADGVWRMFGKDGVS